MLIFHNEQTKLGLNFCTISALKYSDDLEEKVLADQEFESCPPDGFHDKNVTDDDSTNYNEEEEKPKAALGRLDSAVSN